MSAKHTPGPWKYNGKTDIYGASGATICELYRGYEHISECQANANLIAAAPDLLEALTRLRDAEKAPRGEWIDAIANADIAIAKAKGEAQ